MQLEKGCYYPDGQKPSDLDKMRAEREAIAAEPERLREENLAKGIAVTDAEMRAVAVSMGINTQ